MTLLESLLPSYKHLIVALEMMSIKELIINYMTTSLMHKISKRLQNESSCYDVAIELRKGKTGSPSWRKDVKTYYYCDKPGHIAHFSYKANNKDK